MKVSVIIPVKNGEKTIKKTIDSLLNQDYKNVEIIVVDDGSDDSTLKIINSYKERVSLIRHKRTMGPAVSRNDGFKKAKGEIIFFTDADCLTEKNWISELLKEYKSEEIAGVGGYLKPWKNNWVAKLELFQNKYLLGIKDKKIINGAKTPMGYTNNVSYRKRVLEKVHGFDEKFPQPAGEDIDLKKRVCEKGYTVVYVPFPVTHIDSYNWEYLVNRIITRGMEKSPPKNKAVKILYLFFTLPVAIFRIIRKILKYKSDKTL